MSDLRISLIPFGQSYRLPTRIQQGIGILCHKIIGNLCISVVDSILFLLISLSSSITNNHNYFFVHILFGVIIKNIFSYTITILLTFSSYLFLQLFIMTAFLAKKHHKDFTLHDAPLYYIFFNISCFT